MARGFESKQVEAQQEEAGRPRPSGRTLSQPETERLHRRRTLELSRARLLADLGRASRPPHRQMLEQALAAIDQQLREVV